MQKKMKEVLLFFLLKADWLRSDSNYSFNNSAYLSKNRFYYWNKGTLKNNPYAVLVLNFTFRGNNSSVVKINNKLMAVVDNTFKIKSKKVPK